LISKQIQALNVGKLDENDPSGGVINPKNVHQNYNLLTLSLLNEFSLKYFDASFADSNMVINAKKWI